MAPLKEERKTFVLLPERLATARFAPSAPTCFSRVLQSPINLQSSFKRTPESVTPSAVETYISCKHHTAHIEFTNCIIAQTFKKSTVFLNCARHITVNRYNADKSFVYFFGFFGNLTDYIFVGCLIICRQHNIKNQVCTLI